MSSDVGSNSGSIAGKKTKSLLEKYDVPIHHLDFSYVRSCNNAKDLEKIVKILRSKEEGYYPELLECAENQLAVLDNRNPLLRKETKVMTKADLSKEEWNNIATDILEWKGNADRKESRTLENKSQQSYCQLPSVRSTKNGFNNNIMDGNENRRSQRISGWDFKSWDKFDADEECKKLDLEMEKEEEQQKKRSKPKRTVKDISIEESAIDSLGEIGHLSEDEREAFALREKNIGNEFYNSNKIEESIKHYTRSIHLHQTIAGLNNRAAAYLRQCAFNKALLDLNHVLEMDPKNIKARFRRAQSFQHKNLFREAMDDINEVLILEPTHVVASHIADQLRESISKLPKIHRIKVQNKETGKTMIKTVTETEMLNDYKNEKFVEINDWGLPKIMCNCNGKHSNDPGIQHEEHLRYQHLNRNRLSNKLTLVGANKTTESAVAHNSQSAESSKKLEIVEIEKNDPGKEDDATLTKTPSIKIDESRNLCVVADMRTTLEGPSTSRKSDKTLKIDQNILIKDSTNSDTYEASTSSINKKRNNDNDNFFVDNAKELKTGKNIIMQDNRLVSRNFAAGDATNKNVVVSSCQSLEVKMACGCRENFAKFQFKKDWCEMSGAQNSIEKKAQLLKSICPAHLVEAFGNSWDTGMMVDIFKCLLRHFSPEERQRACEYLQVIPHLERFNINVMFLAPDDKPVLQELMKTYSNCVEPSFSNALKL